MKTKNWANWPTISQLINAYNAFNGCYGVQVSYIGNGIFVEEYYVMRGWGGELECDIDSQEIPYIDMYRAWEAYNKWKKSGEPIPTPATEVCSDEYEDLPF